MYIFLSALILLSPVIANAVVTNPLASRFDSIPKLLIALYDGFLQVFTPIIVLIMVYIGFLLVFQKSPEKRKEHRIWLSFALLGIVLVYSARLLLEVFQNTLGTLT